MPADDDGYREHECRFRQLYDEQYRAVQAYAVRRVHNLADVADIAAEVFTIAWRRLGDVPQPPADRVWLYGTARRVLAGYYRGTRRHRSLLSRIENNYQSAPQTADLMPGSPDERLLHAMYQLPPAEREVLMLVYWEELSYAEAGQILGCSANAVGIRMHRAKKRLRQALGIPEGQPPSDTAAPPTTSLAGNGS